MVGTVVATAAWRYDAVAYLWLTESSGTMLFGKTLPHESAHLHVTGEAVYLDDMPPLHGELLVDIVGSPLAHGRIRSIDVADALRTPGIVAILTSTDVPGDNHFGPVFHDEELLVGEECQYIGQPVALLAGTSRDALRAAKKTVRLEVQELPAVLTIDDAIAGVGQAFQPAGRQESLPHNIGPTRRIQRGDVTAAFAAAEHMLDGTFHSGGQEHFYLETQAALAIPGEDGQLTIHSSTQHPSEIQAMAARCLGLRQSQVVCVCRRMGGGFGGKETQGAHPALLAALVAQRTRRPARIVLTCDQDMQITGKRHPYQSRYRVSFTSEGLITGLKIDFYSNGGFSADLSLAVMERTLVHAENAYFIPNVELSGTVCRTNLPSNTAFRGFGGPQAIASIENIIEEIAACLGRDAFDIRRLNCYGIEDCNITPYGQVVENNTLPRLFERLADSANYHSRQAAVREFNRSSRTSLKGLSLIPVKFGISFTRRTLNQANALVNIYLDGTIQVSTGGTEMGQGLNTKIRQLVADEFSLPIDAVTMMPTSTEKNNNTSPTAASAGTDLNGTAAVRACAALRQRLAEVAARRFASVEDGLEASPAHIAFADGMVFDRRRPPHPFPLAPGGRGERGEGRLTFRELVVIAHEQRVSLGERGFYATPGVDFNRETGKGNPFLYYTNGCAAAEVLIDRFTGDVKVLRVDMLMDVGRSINPGVDRGQIIGGFVQGMGWCTTEELRYSPTGALLSHSPTTYKAPNVTDVPAVFNVDLLDNPDNVVNLYGSKAVGEPPLLLGVSVWTAVKHALSFVPLTPSPSPPGGEGKGVRGQIQRLNLPATGEEVLRRLEEFTQAQATSEETVNVGVA